MKTIEAEGLCIKAIDYGDADKLVTVYLRGVGKILCRARGVRKSGAKLKRAAAPFHYGKYILYENNGYYTLRSCDTINSHIKISGDIERYYLSAFMLEVLDKLTRENDDGGELLDIALEFFDKITEYVSLGVCNAYLYGIIVKAGFEIPVGSIDFKDETVKLSLLQAQDGAFCQVNELKTFLFMAEFIEKCGDFKLRTVGEILSLYKNDSAPS